MVLTAPGGRVPKDRSWKAAKVMMAKVDAFLDALINFKKENIHENCLKAIQPYLADSEFKPELVAAKSNAAAGLCSWVINIVKFYEVYCEVEPKRQALSKANAELAAAQEKLAVIKAKINASQYLYILYLIYMNYMFLFCYFVLCHVLCASAFPNSNLMRTWQS